jgi:hypothetical protein
LANRERARALSLSIAVLATESGKCTTTHSHARTHTDTCRYPDPTQTALRAALAELHGVTPDRVVAGAGSDDILDVVLRVVCPTAIVICPPTFGMYTFLAKASGIEVIEVARKADFTVDVDAVRDSTCLSRVHPPTYPPLSATDALLALRCVCMWFISLFALVLIAPWVLPVLSVWGKGVLSHQC